MSQPVKLSDALVLDARLTGEIAERSIAGQIEFWSRLGRAIEPILQGAQSLALQRAGRAKPLSACLDTVDSPEGRQRVASPPPWLIAPVPSRKSFAPARYPWKRFYRYGEGLETLIQNLSSIQVFFI